MRKPIALLIAVAGLAGLAGCGHDVYDTGGANQAQFLQDEASCWDYAEAEPPAVVGYADHGYEMNIAKERNDIRSCMTAKGYTLRPKWPFGPYGVSPTVGPDPARRPLATRQ